MKSVLALATAAAVALGAMCATAAAETAAERTQKAPTKTMGDEGKLPATDSMTGKVPDMTGPQTAETPDGADASDEASGPKGPPKRMGDEGTLPATEKMGTKVPNMTPDASK
jgi:hypothetical protein